MVGLLVTTLVALVLRTGAYMCCSNKECSDKCLAGGVRTCTRYIKDGKPSVKNISAHSSLGTNCFYAGKDPYGWYTVEGSDGIKEAHLSCNTSYCNYCQHEIEQCQFEDKKPLDKLECGCTNDGMLQTRLYNSCLKMHLIKKKRMFNSFCVDNKCNFRKIKHKLEKMAATYNIPTKTLNFETLGYTCVLGYRGLDNTLSYGCDFQLSEKDLKRKNRLDELKISRKVDFSYGRWSLECADGNICNDRRKLMHPIQYNSTRGNITFPFTTKFFSCAKKSAHYSDGQNCDMSRINSATAIFTEELCVFGLPLCYYFILLRFTLRKIIT